MASNETEFNLTNGSTLKFLNSNKDELVSLGISRKLYDDFANVSKEAKVSDSAFDDLMKAAEALKHTKRIYCGIDVFTTLQNHLGILYGNEFKWQEVYFTYKPDMPANAIGSMDLKMIEAMQDVLGDKPIIIRPPAEVRNIDIKINAQESITCPKCQRTSYNRNDIQHKYCNQCGYHDD